MISGIRKCEPRARMPYVRRATRERIRMHAYVLHVRRMVAWVFLAFASCASARIFLTTFAISDLGGKIGQKNYY